MENINEALSLLMVGMIMVFIILTLVVVIGNAVIRLTNRYVPVTPKTSDGRITGRSIHTKKIAAIAAVVDFITQGEGRVDSVEENK